MKGGERTPASSSVRVVAYSEVKRGGDRGTHVMGGTGVIRGVMTSVWGLCAQAGLVKELVESKHLPRDDVEKGMGNFLEILEDESIDNPNAPKVGLSGHARVVPTCRPVPVACCMRHALAPRVWKRAAEVAWRTPPW